jgi:hypothetical protein
MGPFRSVEGVSRLLSQPGRLEDRPEAEERANKVPLPVDGRREDASPPSLLPQNRARLLTYVI